MRQLTSLDAQFLAVESARVYGHVAFLGIYDPSTAPGGRLDAESLQRLLAERVHLLPPLRWRLVRVPFELDFPYWAEDPDFDLDFHIRETAVPPPGSDRQLAETAARLFGRPLDRNRPLWELYVIEGLQDGRVAVLTKIHHSVVDGISGNEIMTTLLDPEPTGRVIDPRPADQAPRPVPDEVQMLMRGMLGLPRPPTGGEEVMGGGLRARRRPPLRAVRPSPGPFAASPNRPGGSGRPGVLPPPPPPGRVGRPPAPEEGRGVFEVTMAPPPRTP